MIYQHEAIYMLYPNVIKINNITAYDKNDEVVEYDQDAVDAKAVELENQQIAKEQAKIDAKESAISKLSALGLTQEEIKSLLGIS
jgi:hypothetical protein